MKEFICESEVYQLLNQYQIGIPKYFTLQTGECISEKTNSFKDGEPVVIKGMAKDLWHKSDEGALFFCSYSLNEIEKIHHDMFEKVGSKFDWIGSLICEKVAFSKVDGLPSEALVSIKREESCGVVIRFGVGGIYTEAWAKELNSSVLIWPLEITTSEQAYNELSNHWIGKVWLGRLRQGKSLISEQNLKEFIAKLWKLGNEMDSDIELVEMNPIVIKDGYPVALDGVGERSKIKNSVCHSKKVDAEKILNPETIAIAGISSKKGSFGNSILKNLMDSSIPKENFKIIKPGVEEFEGIKCYESVKPLLDNPVDMLILVVPAPVTLKIIEELCQQGGGVEVVYLVAGGLGDGADKAGLGKKITGLLNERREKGLWTPALIGPNSLGIKLSPKKINTVFVPQSRLPVDFHSKGNIGFISQSGAYFITRFSNENYLPIKYGLCVGNQMDLRISDFLDILASDDDIKVIAVYAEGFEADDALQLSIKAKELKKIGKQVVLYKAGRSNRGMKAAAGHTGAVAGNYQLQKRLFQDAGMAVTESFKDFSSMMKWLSAYPKFIKLGKVGVVANAGFETVASADHLGVREDILFDLSKDDHEKLTNIFKENRVDGLVSAANPLDITPMSNEKVYIKSIEAMAQSEADTIIVGLIPLTVIIEAFDLEKVKNFAESIKKIAQDNNKPIAIVVDSGQMYDNYRDVFTKVGLPVFRSIEDPLTALVRLELNEF